MAVRERVGRGRLKRMRGRRIERSSGENGGSRAKRGGVGGKKPIKNINQKANRDAEISQKKERQSG